MGIEEKKERIGYLIELADVAIKSIQPNNHHVDTEKFNAFRSASLSFVFDLYNGKEHPHYENFKDSCKKSTIDESKAGKGILTAIKYEIENDWGWHG